MKFQAQSSIVINADLNKVKAFVADFNNWPSWSPWSIIEPDHKGTVTGEPGTIGHTMTWDGKVIGSGVNKVTAVDEKKITYDLEFLSPYKSKSVTTFVFEEKEGGTKVTWTMDSSMPFFMFFMIKKMKAWIEMDYARGLSMLKAILETGKINAKTTNKGVVDFEGFSYVGVKMTSTTESMSKDMPRCFEKVMNLLNKHGKVAKHWISLYTKTDMVNKTFTYIAAASAEHLDGIELPKEFVRGEIKSGRCLQIKHDGSYKFLGNAWSMGMMQMRALKMKGTDTPFEYYHNNPNDTEESKLETSVYFPTK